MLSLLSKRVGVEVVPNDLIVEGIADEQHPIGVTRSHLAPDEIIRPLATRGWLGPRELTDLNAAS